MAIKWVVPVLIFGLGAVACVVPVEEPSQPDGREVSPVDPALVLPPFSAEALQQREAELQIYIQSDLDLAGLGKISGVGQPISLELAQFRQDWAAVDSEIAPFLGTWVRDWNLMPHDFMWIFPSTVPGQVCLVRYRQTETETVPFEIITTPLEFSVALVRDGQLLGPSTQTAQSLIRPTPASAYVAYAVEFLGTVEASGELRHYAAQQPPAFDPTWEADLKQKLDAFQCQDSAGTQ
jgi:hypothetical protein